MTGGGEGGAVAGFLRYSLLHGRKIRAVFWAEGRLRLETIQVTALAPETVTYTTARRKTPLTRPLAELLSCDYARGDHGETDDETGA